MRIELGAVMSPLTYVDEFKGIYMVRLNKSRNDKKTRVGTSLIGFTQL